MSETTFKRYKRVLEEIAAGAKSPMVIAALALESRIVPPSPEKSAERSAKAARTKERREQRDQLARITYASWMEAGRPPIATYARLLKISTGRLKGLLRHAERGWPHRSKRMGAYRNPKYLTFEELWAQEDVRSRS